MVAGSSLRVVQCVTPHAVGGIESMVRNLAMELRQRDVQVTVLAMIPDGGDGGRWIAGLEAAGVPCRTLTPSRLPWRDAGAIRAALGDLAADIVHTHGYRMNILVGAGSGRTPPRRVATVHGWIDTDWKLRCYNRLDRHALRRFDRVLPVSPTMRPLLERAGVPSDRIEVVLNAIPDFVDRPAPDRAKAEVGLPPDALVVGTVGRLSREKGHADLLSAFARAAAAAPRLHLVLVGDGPCRSDLEALAARSGTPERIHFLGTRSDLGRLYSAFDILALPSHTEGCPTVLLEAMAAGLPVVATTVGAIPAMIEDGREGHLSAPQAPADLARGLSRLAENAQARHRMGAASRRRYEESFSPGPWLDRVVAVYRATLAEAGR